MKINEVSKLLGLTKRAIKFYEAKGLLQVGKDDNGYRNYSEQEILRLKKISVCRRLGMSIADTKRYLMTDDPEILLDVLKEKQKTIRKTEDEIQALQAFIQDQNIDEAYVKIDYQNIAQAMKEAIPGFYGYFFMHHFIPYLQERIHTEEQYQAYVKIIDFWDNTKIRIPFLIKITGWLTWKLNACGKERTAKDYAERLDEQLQKYLDPDTEQHNQLKRQVIRGYRMKKILRFHPVFMAQRKLMKELQNKGYNDIFIPNMSKLSPAYKKYHEALMRTNTRICQELGLYYDADFHLVKR